MVVKPGPVTVKPTVLIPETLGALIGAWAAIRWPWASWNNFWNGARTPPWANSLAT